MKSKMFKNIKTNIVLLSLVFIVGVFVIPVQSWANDNKYQLLIPKVQVGESSVDTTKVSPLEYQFNGVLTPNDKIRLGWSNIDLNLIKAKQLGDSAKSYGYIKIYKEEVKEENVIIEIDESPLAISKIASKIKEGQNKLIFLLFIGNQETDQKIEFGFKFVNTINKPTIKIITPQDGVVINKDVGSKFNLLLTNFTLDSNATIDNHGFINVYLNSVSNDNLITKINETANQENSNNQNINETNIKFSSSIFGNRLNSLPDSLDNKLIFKLVQNTKPQAEDISTEIKIITNFNNTLNVSLPSVEFTNITDKNNNINFNDTIRLKISNFQTTRFDSSNSNEKNKGYLQILIDDKPVKIAYTESEFTLKDLVPNLSKDKIKLTVKLANYDFTQLDYPAEKSIDLFVSNKEQSNGAGVIISNWRLISIGLTLLLITVSVVYLIFKG